MTYQRTQPMADGSAKAEDSPSRLQRHPRDYDVKSFFQAPLSQRVHVAVWSLLWRLRAQRGSHIHTLGPKYVLIIQLHGPFGLLARIFQTVNSNLDRRDLATQHP